MVTLSLSTSENEPSVNNRTVVAEGAAVSPAPISHSLRQPAPRTHLLALLVATLALAAACTSDAAPAPGPAPTASATAEVTTTRSPPASAAPATDVPPDTLEVLATVWLIDVRDDMLITIAEDAEDYPASATFNLAGLPVLEYWRPARTQVMFDTDGTFLGTMIPEYACQQIDDDSVHIGDREYEGITCGLLSPNDRWMLYAVDAGTIEVSADYQVPAWDQWLIDLETDERTLLHAGMRHCGGCDGRFGPAWSSSGRYIYFPELYGDGDVFLTDALTGETRLLASGSRATELARRPVWSPLDDLLLYPAEDSLSRLDNLTTGTTLTLTDVPWPAWFDPSGRYVYTSADDGERLPSSPRETSVFDSTTGQLVATREGVPSSGRVHGAGGDPIAVTAGGIVAALEGVVDRRGTAIYREGSAEGFCIKGGFGASVSPDGSRVALAVRGEGVPTHFVPSDLESVLQLYDIVIVDVATGATRAVATEAVSGASPPQIEWNSSSTQILVRWPAWFGV